MQPVTSTHERLTDDETIKGSGNRTFGVTVAAAFLLTACWPLLRGGPLRWWALAAAAVFLGAAMATPRALAPLNRFWLALGARLHRVTNPVIMGVVFFTTVAPLGLLFRILGKDPLHLRRDPSASTYWIERRPPGPPPSTMTRQF